VIIENVPPVLWDTCGVVAKTTEALSHAGYKIAGAVVDLRRVGVPQRRRRYLLIGSRVGRVCPTDILAQLTSAMRGHPDRTVRWAVHDLLDLESGAVYNTASRTSVENARRIQYLFDEDRRDLPNSERPECHRDGKHSYISMYGRLSWDDPAQTITTGFGSMGQGRYVHPEKRRTITPHEAARLQTFPDWFDFGNNTRRGILAKAIGNAVPPLLMVALGDAAIEALSRCEPITIPIPS
jgi:DNA (cytosine-5)-methyltransferase 1